MKNLSCFFIQFGVPLLFFACLSGNFAWGQSFPFIQILHTSGKQDVGCTEVTVTPKGCVDVFNGSCGYGPYDIGNNCTGSYIFTFNPAVVEAKVSFSHMHHLPPLNEEIIFYLNGSFYPINNTGMVDNCLSPPIIWPPGTIRAQIGEIASSQDITITETISSLEIEDNWVSGSPVGIYVSLYIRCQDCQTDAGEITAIPLDLCPSDLATVPPAEQTVLDNDDLLQYILFSDLTDTLGSILSTSSTPQFAFNPATMQFGISYYIAAIVGNDFGGNVDLNDPCLDISNAIEVVWHPEPTVTFFSTNTNLCPGYCQYIAVYFTGTTPFVLTYTMPGAGSVTETFLANNGNIEFCTPLGTPLGNWELQAIDLVDANCSCN